MNVNDIFKDMKSIETQHKFTKMMLGSIAGFVVALVVEKIYDSIIESHQDNSEENQP